MHFNQGGHTQLVDLPMQFLQLLQLQRSDNQQDSIGPSRTRLVDLIAVHDEIFTQRGQASRFTCCTQIV